MVGSTAQAQPNVQGDNSKDQFMVAKSGPECNGKGDSSPKCQCSFLGLDDIARFEDDEFPSVGSTVQITGSIGGQSATIDITSTNSGEKSEAGVWDATVPVYAVFIKGGTNYTIFDYTPDSYFTDEFQNQTGKGFSHITFCGKAQVCDGNPYLNGDDEVDRDANTVSNIIKDDNGIKRFEFTSLNNFEITSTFDSGYVNDASTGEYEWKWTGTLEDAPTEVPYTLTAPEDGAASYYLFATNICDHDSQLDPPYDFSVEAAATALEGSYPNPTQGQTTLSFSTAEPGPVTLAIYDVTGRKVATVVDGLMPAGPHTVAWNGGTELASGVYLVRLKVGDRVQTRRLTIVR